MTPHRARTWRFYRPFLEIIEELKEEHGSINAAARAIGMPEATLHSLGRGGEPTLETLRLIAEARQMPLWELIRQLED